MATRYGGGRVCRLQWQMVIANDKPAMTTAPLLRSCVRGDTLFCNPMHLWKRFLSTTVIKYYLRVTIVSCHGKHIRQTSDEFVFRTRQNSSAVKKSTTTNCTKFQLYKLKLFYLSPNRLLSTIEKRHATWFTWRNTGHVTFILLHCAHLYK